MMLPRIEGKPLETVCFVVGPLRNLTTLISAVMAFHPNCQVLYQGYNRLESNTWMFHMDRFEELIGEWLVASTNDNGPCGVGSVARSHAFSPSAFATYLARYEDGAGQIKEDIKCLFLWRHPSILINHFEEKKVNIPQLLAWDDSIRFLMPIRNPLDCFYKNYLLFTEISGSKWMKSHYHSLTSKNGVEFGKDFLNFLIKCYNWIFSLQDEHPDRFFYFFEDEIIDEKFLRRVAGFLKLPYDTLWVSDTLNHFALQKPDYQLDPEWVNLYLQALEGVILHKDKLASYANERRS